MRIKAGSVWWIMAWGLIFCSEVLSASPYRRQGIPIEAGESICSLSKTLKEVVPWTQSQLEALKKTRDAYTSKFLEWLLHFNGSSECVVNEDNLETIRTNLENVNEEINKLPAKAIRAGALAAKSAGRLDEFITVFANAKKTGFIDGVNYCLGGGGEPARRRDLLDCFPDGEKLEMGESNLGKIPESMSNKKELNLAAALKSANHSVVGAYFRRIVWDDIYTGCNLINGKTGILSGALNDKLWWGGGILTIGKCFDGEMKKDSFIAGETKDKDTNDKALWTASPHTIPHLKKTLAAFHDFKDSAAKITQKLDEIGKIESQIEPCLSNETTEQGPTQSCFQNAVKLNAELKAANDLLARYQKEKGPLTSASALTLRPSVMSLWCLIAALA